MNTVGIMHVVNRSVSAILRMHRHCWKSASTLVDHGNADSRSVKGMPDETIDVTIAAPTVPELQKHIPQLLQQRVQQ